MRPDKKNRPLFRKVNSKAIGVRHGSGSEYRYSRNTKKETRETTRGSMNRRKRHGLDYTPLFKFLLSRIGEKWDIVFSEAKSRIDKVEPIFWIVSLDEHNREEFVRTGEASYISGMYVDDEGILQLTNPELRAEDMKPFCSCCTHTFNGEIFGKKF